MSNQTFAKNLKYLRKKRGWSQKQLAAKIYISRQLLYKLEALKQSPNLAIAERACDALGVDLITITKVDMSLLVAKAS